MATSVKRLFDFIKFGEVGCERLPRIILVECLFEHKSLFFVVGQNTSG